MKKFLSILAVLCLFLTFITVPSVSAAENYCEKIENAVGSVRWYVGINTVAENESFSTHAIMYYTFFKTRDDKYGTQFDEQANDYLKMEIPSSVFEGMAKKLFAKVDTAALRSYTDTVWDNETSQHIENFQLYNSTKDVYVFDNFGGMGDSSRYVMKGYVDSNGKLTAYLNYGEPYDKTEFPDIINGKTEGVDYVDLGEAWLMVEKVLKTVVKIVDGQVQFHSWELLNTMPAVSGLIVPGQKLTDANTSVPSSTQTSSKQETPKDESSKVETASKEETTSSENGTSSVIDDSLSMDTVAETETVTVKTEENVFPENTVVNVEEIKNEGAAAATYVVVENALKETAAKFVAYEINAESEGVKVQPNGKVLAYFDIPEGFDPANTVVLYVSPDGTVEEISSTVHTDEGYIVAELTHFSTYVVAEKKITDPDTQKANTPVVIIVMIVVLSVLVLAAVAVALWYFLVFKKKK